VRLAIERHPNPPRSAVSMTGIVMGSWQVQGGSYRYYRVSSKLAANCKTNTRHLTAVCGTASLILNLDIM
jgi:hypothetical protein